VIGGGKYHAVNSIREEQIKVMTASGRRTFAEKLVHELHGRYVDDCRKIPPDSLGKLVSKGIEKAIGYGITSEWGVSMFVRFACMYGSDFVVQIPDVDLVLATR